MLAIGEEERSIYLGVFICLLWERRERSAPVAPSRPRNQVYPIT